MIGLRLDDKKLIQNLIVIAGTFVFFNIANTLLGEPSWQITRLIGLEQESNLTTWFSSMLLALAAFYAYLSSTQLKEDKVGQRMWQLLALGFLAMSCDEVAMIHENLGTTMNKYFFHLSSINRSAWVVVLGPFILAGIIIFAAKMKRYFLGSPAVRWLLLGSCVYIGGAFILEASINLLNHENLEWLFKTENILEESCELFGVIFLIKGLSQHKDYLLNSKR